MSLTLAAPSTDPIRTYPNGLKVVRLTDYIGAARGDLSIVADTYGVASNVVKDEQTIAVPTTGGSKWASVADTCTIPLADLAFPADSRYFGYLAIRSEGRPPVTARKGEKFNLWQEDATPNVNYGYDGTNFSVSNNPVPREIYANYNMIDLGSFGPDFDGGATDLNIRAWGIASGTWVAWYLDCLYFIPYLLKTTDTNGLTFPTDFAWFIGQSVNSPTLPATDEDANTTLLERSVFFNPQDGTMNEGAGWDIQESDGENTEFDWHFVWNDADSILEKSYIYWVGLTSRLINAHEIENADFSDTGPDPSGPPPTAPFVQQYTTPQGYEAINGAFSAGEWYFADGCMRFRTYNPAWSEPNPYPLGADSYDPWSIGAMTHHSTFSSTDPRTYAAQMDSLESFIFTHKCVPIDGIPSTGMRYQARGERWTGENTGIQRTWFGPVIDIASTGAATVQFVTNPNEPAGHANEPIGASVSVPDNLSTDFWIKLEKRLYVWRVKIWLDGNTEPTSWLLTADEPASLFHAPGSVSYTMEYPWDTGFIAGAVTDLNNPRKLPRERANSSTGLRGWTPAGVVTLPAGFSQPAWRFDITPVIVEYDPDIEDEGTYTDANFRLEKYDASEQWGEVKVDTGTCRVAFSNYAPHHFDDDNHGGNISAWKDPGSHPLQAAGYGILYFRRYVLGGVIPLYRPRVFSVSDV